MSISLHNCWTCGVSLLDLDRPDESMFWCSDACEAAYEDKVRESLSSSDQETDEVIPANEAPEASSTPAREGIRDVAFSVRRQKTCGRCGGKGHNARTCKGRAKSAAKPSSTPVVESKGSKAPSVVKVSGRGGPGKQKTCGKCGGKGHNARTCGKN